MKIKARWKDKKFVGEEVQEMKKYLDQFTQSDLLSIDIKRYQNTRSNKQNSWYWGVCVKTIRNFFEDKGYDLTSDDVHEWLKKKYLGSQDVEGVEITKSTKNLSTIEFSERFKDRIQRDFAELGLIIPDPNQEDFLQTKES